MKTKSWYYSVPIIVQFTDSLNCLHKLPFSYFPGTGNPDKYWQMPFEGREMGESEKIILFTVITFTKKENKTLLFHRTDVYSSWTVF